MYDGMMGDCLTHSPKFSNNGNCKKFLITQLHPYNFEYETIWFRVAWWNQLSLSEVLEKTRLVFSHRVKASCFSQTQEWNQRKYFILCGRSQWLFIDSAFGATRATTALYFTFRIPDASSGALNRFFKSSLLSSFFFRILSFTLEREYNLFLKYSRTSVLGKWHVQWTLSS